MAVYAGVQSHQLRPERSLRTRDPGGPCFLGRARAFVPAPNAPVLVIGLRLAGPSALAGHGEELGRRLIKGKRVKVRVLED
jgi:hypothetical protein